MCLACDMEAMWFAVMEARAAAGAVSAPQPDEPATDLPSPQADDPLLPPPEEGGGSASAELASNEFVSNDGAANVGARQRAGVTPPRRFACEETPAE